MDCNRLEMLVSVDTVWLDKQKFLAVTQLGWICMEMKKLNNIQSYLHIQEVATTGSTWMEKFISWKIDSENEQVKYNRKMNLEHSKVVVKINIGRYQNKFLYISNCMMFYALVRGFLPLSLYK